MKIVLSTHRFLPRFAGGVETYTLRLAQAFQQLGHEVHIVTGEPQEKESLAVEVEEGSYEGIPVIRLGYDYHRRPVTYRAGYSDPLVTAQIKTVLQRLRPDVVHATSLSLLMAGTIEATWQLDLPLIYTATDFVLTCRRGLYLKRDNTICTAREELARCTACMGPHTRLERLLTHLWQVTPGPVGRSLLPVAEKIIGKKADFLQAGASIRHRLDYLPKWTGKIERIIAPSTYMRDMFVLNGFPAEKITVSPYGVVPPEQILEKVPASRLRFGFIGRVTFIKGVHLLLEAFARLPDQDQAELTLYGKADVKSDRYMQKLQSRAAQWPTLKFAGFVDNAHLAELYRRLDLLVVPSIWPENSPITILEAQAHGVPVIASDVGGIADLVQPGVNGLLFANQDVEALADQMSRCLNSPELVTRLARQSRLIKSIQEDAVEIIGLYRNVIEQEGR